jgi:hypothetical protein
MNGIVLRAYNGQVLAEFHGTEGTKVHQLFGTTVLPTPFSAAANRDQVKSTVESLNPGVFVMWAVEA